MMPWAHKHLGNKHCSCMLMNILRIAGHVRGCIQHRPRSLILCTHCRLSFYALQEVVHAYGHDIATGLMEMKSWWLFFDNERYIIPFPEHTNWSIER